MNKHALSLLALALAGGLAEGQALPKAQSQLPMAETPILGHYRLIAATGEILPEPPPGEGGPEAGGCGNPVINSFLNLDNSTRYIDGAITFADIEFVDWGIITTQTESDIVAQISIGYGTLDLDQSVGGPGASLDIAFYSGYTGFCDPGTAQPVAEFSFTGLPGATTPNLSAGYILTVDLAGGMEFILPEGEFGFSQRYQNVSGTPTSTGLLQSFAGDPIGDMSSADVKGQVTGLDNWVPDLATGTCVGTFRDSLDATGIPVGSHYLLLRKSNAPATPPAAAVLRNDASSTNPLALFAGGTPVLGSAFSLIATSTGPGEQGVFLAGYTLPTEIATPFGSLLIDVTDPSGDQIAAAGLSGPHVFANGFAAVTLTLPIDLNLCGFDLAVQAAQFGTALRLTNAVDLTLGVR